MTYGEAAGGGGVEEGAMRAREPVAEGLPPRDERPRGVGGARGRV